MIYRETDIFQAQWGDGMIAVFLKHFHTLMSERKWESVFVTCSALLEISQKVQEKKKSCVTGLLLGSLRKILNHNLLSMHVSRVCVSDK